MLPSTALQFVQQHPLITTNSPEFRNLGLRDDQPHESAYQLIKSYPFIGQTTTVYNNKGGSSETMSDTASQVGSIKKYLKAFIDVDPRESLLRLQRGEPDCNNCGNHIRGSGRQFYDGKYKHHFDDLFSSVG